MPVHKLQQSVLNLSKALDRLEEALQEPKRNKLAIDGTIQRFEFTIELYWKYLKRLLASQGIETLTPRQSLQKAFQAGWLVDQDLWIRMLDDRNETSHIYDDNVAKAIYKRIKKYFPEMKETYVRLQEMVLKKP